MFNENASDFLDHEDLEPSHEMDQSLDMFPPNSSPRTSPVPIRSQVWSTDQQPLVVYRNNTKLRKPEH